MPDILVLSNVHVSNCLSLSVALPLASDIVLTALTRVKIRLLLVVLTLHFSDRIDVVLLDPGPHRHDRTARGFCVFRACRISKVA